MHRCLFYPVDHEKNKTCPSYILPNQLFLQTLYHLVQYMLPVSFQYFQVQDGDEQRPLCFLFSKVKKITSYRCDELEKLSHHMGSAFLGTKSRVSERTSRGQRAVANHTTNATANAPANGNNAAFCAATC